MESESTGSYAAFVGHSDRSWVQQFTAPCLQLMREYWTHMKIIPKYRTQKKKKKIS